jgi:hypothetical protein
MADDLAAFAHKLDKLKSDLSGGALQRIVTRVGVESKKTAIGAIHPNSLSNWGKRSKGATVKARYEVRGTHEVAVQPTVAPLAALLNDGGHNPWSAPKRRGSKRRKKGSIGTYTRAEVPARHSWDNAVKVVEPKVPEIVHKEVQRVLGGIW